ncbi:MULTISPECIES: glutaredoxin domain-containing protein [unclassified Gemella]|uniref:glutaredoxin domain-containing protein n=1 Tax=unclassified Gemella TaxID=2624949 RepID=UPI0010738534|nr:MULTISPECIES: glutaredoxin domain-containing protein [unclassified Gemella]MBF0709742.1 NrdH-redoxin [Gemella sp. GL1.1]MBF0747259.1 NrdH-redoxin [Gemella sp. 19428wG2_WT2a]NYS27086.1 NrdH-redoxin [Gemella sp. GL1]TFU57844.1 NrdH-redoxin [Gemella sp. WT2a]
MTNKIIVYTTVPCVNCSTTKEMMKFHEIKFEEVATHNLDNSDDVIDMLREKGFTQFPVISVNDWEDSWCGFQPDRIENYSGKYNE